MVKEFDRVSKRSQKQQESADRRSCHEGGTRAFGPPEKITGSEDEHNGSVRSAGHTHRIQRARIPSYNQDTTASNKDTGTGFDTTQINHGRRMMGVFQEEE